MWTLHHPNDCEAGKTTTSATTNANIAAFDTMDSNSDNRSLPTSGGLMADVPCLDRSLDGC